MMHEYTKPTRRPTKTISCHAALKSRQAFVRSEQIDNKQALFRDLSTA